MLNRFTECLQLAGHLVRYHSAVAPAAQDIGPIRLISFHDFNVFSRDRRNSAANVIIMIEIVRLYYSKGIHLPDALRELIICAAAGIAGVDKEHLPGRLV